MTIKKVLLGITLAALMNACATTGSLNEQGFTHDAIYYSVQYQNSASKAFLPESWTIDRSPSGAVSIKENRTFSVESKRIDEDMSDRVFVQNFDLLFKHKETNGAIAVMSFPLSEEKARKKLDLLAGHFAELLADRSFNALGNPASSNVNLADALLERQMVTNLLALKESRIGKSEMLTAEFDVAQSAQLKIDPTARLKRGKIVIIRPESGWNSKVLKRNHANKVIEIDARYPTAIVLTYVMDAKYYEQYLPEFENFVKQLRLKPSAESANQR